MLLQVGYEKFMCLRKTHEYSLQPFMYENFSYFRCTMDNDMKVSNFP